jgi:hypothetical protein
MAKWVKIKDTTLLSLRGGREEDYVNVFTGVF